jgi:uncharacterized protein (TIGR03435 family)
MNDLCGLENSKLACLHSFKASVNDAAVTLSVRLNAIRRKEPEASDRALLIGFDLYVTVAPQKDVSNGPGQLACFGASMSELAAEFPDLGLSRVVLDKTGLTGRYDFSL